MELEKAKKELNRTIEENNRLLLPHNEQFFNKKERKEIEQQNNAILVVLQALDNSIPKEKVKLVLEREIKQLEDNPQYSWVGSEWSEREVVEELEDIKKELLEE